MLYSSRIRHIVFENGTLVDGTPQLYGTPVRGEAEAVPAAGPPARGADPLCGGISAIVLRNPSARFALCALLQRLCIHQELVIDLLNLYTYRLVYVFSKTLVLMHAVSAVTRHSCLLVESATHCFLCGPAWPFSHISHFKDEFVGIGMQLNST
jgi:hypothetical protein